MWQWIAAAALAAVGGGLAQLMGDVSSPLNDYNYGEDRAGRIRVFARSEADFANGRIFVSERKGRKFTTPGPIAFTTAGGATAIRGLRRTAARSISPRHAPPPRAR